jgi:hypothetical protein
MDHKLVRNTLFAKKGNLSAAQQAKLRLKNKEEKKEH